MSPWKSTWNTKSCLVDGSNQIVFQDFNWVIFSFKILKNSRGPYPPIHSGIPPNPPGSTPTQRDRPPLLPVVVVFPQQPLWPRRSSSRPRRFRRHERWKVQGERWKVAQLRHKSLEHIVISYVWYDIYSGLWNDLLFVAVSFLDIQKEITILIVGEISQCYFLSTSISCSWSCTSHLASTNGWILGTLYGCGRPLNPLNPWNLGMKVMGKQGEDDPIPHLTM